MNFYSTSISILFYSIIVNDVRTEDDKYLITLVYRFVFANEAICGDPFAEPEWLPAAGKCFVNCDPTVYLCMMHTNSNIQKCRLYSKACQAAIRKHLGWSTTIVSVFRPPITTTPSQNVDFHVENAHRAFRDDELVAQREPMNADRAAIEAAESIERDLMGFDTTTQPSSSPNELGPNESSVVVEVITQPPTSNEFSWLEAPHIETNGYSFEDSSSSMSESSRQHSNEPDDSISEYDGLAENVVRPTLVNEETAREGSSVGRQFEYALPQPPAPKPSPPAFPPFNIQEPTRNGIEPPPEKELVPKFINFLEVPEDRSSKADEEPFRTIVPQPPGFRPIEGNDLIEEDSWHTDNTNLQPSEPVIQSTTQSWGVTPKRPYQNMRIVPSDTEVALPEGSALRPAIFGNKFSVGGARFEVMPRPAPLSAAIPLGMVSSKEMLPITELPRRVHHFTDPLSRKKVFADVQPDKARDYSRRCCEWSLSGLCDRHWRRIRSICPKSCGSLVCDDIEGMKSCTRIVDVDVEDCFQSSRLSRYFGLKNAETEEEKRSVIEGIIHQKLDGIGHRRRVIVKKRH